uniref:Uncharacterized protein n=1 Tax=Eutreptiella gymnastica TaxID=73025 RepID=A0A7S1I7X8_9EUGL
MSAAAGAITTEDGCIIKESSTHKGHFYKYNPADGSSEWLPEIPRSLKGKLTASSLEATGLDSTKGKGRRPISRSSRATAVSWGTDDTELSECLCTICECGKHACPVHKYKPCQFGGNSRYREDYPAHPCSLRNKMAPRREAKITPADADHFKSKYLEDFVPHTPDPPTNYKPKVAAPMATPFNATTTNRDMFDAKPVERKMKRRPPSPPKRALPFDGTTTNRETFKGHPEAKPRESMAPPVRTIPSTNFEGTTKYTEDFPAHNVQGYKKVAPEHKPYDYGPPRDLSTEQRQAFDKKPITYCPVIDLPKKEPSATTGHIHYTKRCEDGRYGTIPAKPKA